MQKVPLNRQMQHFASVWYQWCIHENNTSASVSNLSLLINANKSKQTAHFFFISSFYCQHQCPFNPLKTLNFLINNFFYANWICQFPFVYTASSSKLLLKIFVKYPNAIYIKLLVKTFPSVSWKYLISTCYIFIGRDDPTSYHFIQSSFKMRNSFDSKFLFHCFQTAVQKDFAEHIASHLPKATLRNGFSGFWLFIINCMSIGTY